MKKHTSSILLIAMVSMLLAGCGSEKKDNLSDSCNESIVQVGATITDETKSSEAVSTEISTVTTTEAATTETSTETTAESVTTEIVTETTTESVTTETSTETTTEASTTEIVTEITTYATEAKEVFALNGPLARKQSVREYDNAKFSASFKMNDLGMNEEGMYTLTVKVYSYEYFSGEDILSLKAGDTVYCLGQPVKVETVETYNGMIRINGGIENGGRVFKTTDNTVYFESGMNDRKSYYVIGENTYVLSENFIMTDNSVMDFPKTYTAEEFAAFSDDAAGFRNSNTIVNTSDGVITSVVRNYIP